MSKDSRFWNKAAKKYSEQPIADPVSYEHKLKKTQEYLTKSSDVLEIGCGTGSTALIHAPHVKNYLGIDLSSEMISIANTKVKNSNINNLLFTSTSIDNFSAETKFDTVLALSVLHLMDNRDKTIKQVHELLAQGGLFISSTVCLAEKMKFFKVLAPIGRFLGFMPMLRVFSHAQLKKDLIENGFAIDYQWFPNDGRYGTIFLVARKV